jgi:hypothetical protein
VHETTGRIGLFLSKSVDVIVTWRLLSRTKFFWAISRVLKKKRTWKEEGVLSDTLLFI